MRVVAFGGNPDSGTPHCWRVLFDMPAIERILVCGRAGYPRKHHPCARFRQILARYGVVQNALLGLKALRWPFLRRPPSISASSASPASKIELLDLHAPDVVEQVRAFDADLGISLDPPALSPLLSSLPRLGTIRLQLEVVPELRGSLPAYREHRTRATTIRATVHWADEVRHAGCVIATAEAPIYAVDRQVDVEARAADLQGCVLREAIGQIAGSEQPQGPAPWTDALPTALHQEVVLGWHHMCRRLRGRLAPRWVLKAAFLACALHLYRPIRDAVRTLRARHPVRVFTFHRITTLCRDGMTVAPAQFRDQIAYVLRHHDVVTLEQGVELIRSSARLRRPAAVLTFDDGYRSVFTIARPILADFGVPGCCFVSTDLVGTDRRFSHDRDNAVRRHLDVMDWEELATLRAEGWSVGSHTASHARLSACSSAEIMHEIEDSRRALRERLGAEASALAYTFGAPDDITDEALETARHAGHEVVFANYGWGHGFRGSSFLLGRWDIGGDHEVLAWKNRTHGLDFGRWRSSQWHPAPRRPSVGAAGAKSGTRPPIRITHVVFDFHGGGLESLVADMAARFVGTSVSLSLITLSGRVGRLGALTRDRFEQFHVVRQLAGFSMLLPVRLSRAIRQTRADVVHLHTGCWYKGARAARLAGVRWLVYTEHGREHDDPPLSRWLDRRAATHTSAIVTVSNRLARYLAANVGIDSARICTIHNAVDTSVFTPGSAPFDLRTRLGIPPGAYVIGSVGRLEPVKAYEQLIEVTALLRGRLRRPLVLVICGEGSQRHALHRCASRLGVGELTRLPGWIDRPVEIYRLLDLFALSSLSEGQSLSLMEAMACGVAPVVTNVGANAEMLGPKLQSQVVPVGQPETLAGAIHATLTVPGRARSIARMVRIRALEHYSLERMVEDYERVYRAVAEGVAAQVRSA